jgi:hypothetical protein
MLAPDVRRRITGDLLLVSRKHFQCEVGYDDHGLIVTVTHKVTGLRKMDRPGQGENISTLQSRLIREMRATFCDDNDFVFHMGRCVVDGRVGDWYEVEHVPTQRRKSFNTVSSPDVKRAREWLLDSLVQELWDDAVLGPKPVERVQ